MARGVGWAALVVVFACGQAGSTSFRNGGMLPDGGPGDGGAGCADCFPLRTSPLVAENQRAGTTAWRPSNFTTRLGLYTTRPSYAPGDQVEARAALSGGATTATWQLFRIGYYGGKGGRLVLSGGPFAVQQQPASTIDPQTGAVRAPWAASFTFTIPSDAPTGVYILNASAPEGDTSAVFVVREATPAATILYPLSMNTYEAYNAWGGTSLYQNRLGWKPPGASAAPGHAYAVSFDRPFDQGNGTGDFRGKDRELVVFAEAQGYDVAYATDVDLETDPSLTARRRMVAMQGHSEYWTKGMRDAVEGAIAHGTNVAFFAANDSYWQVRFADAQMRLLLGYKEYCASDPMRAANPSLATCNWRDPVVGRPENGMIGEMFGYWIWAQSPLQVTNPSHWLWSGARVDAQTIIPGVYGIEVDRRFANGAEPAGVETVAQGAVGAFDGSFGTGQTTIYTAPSGALVFSAGSIGWSKAVAGEGLWDARIQQLVANLFARFAGDGKLPATVHPTDVPAPGEIAYRPGVRVSTVTTSLTAPAAVAATTTGDAIVADGNRIVRVSGGGDVMVIAGSDAAGLRDGPAEQALFAGPRGVAVAPDGTIYVSDTGNSRIRVVRGGMVSTLAGSDQGFADGPGASARFSRPMGIALRANGNLLVADSRTMRLREVTPSGTVNTWAGNGANAISYGAGANASLSYPMAVAVLPGGDAVVVEPQTGILRRVAAAPPHVVSNFAGVFVTNGWGDGPLSSATLSDVVALAARADGQVVLADAVSARVRVISGGTVSTLAGGARGGTADGDGRDAAFTAPRGIAISPDGSALVVDVQEHALRKVEGL